MNQRIREFAEQADIHFSKSGTLDAGPNGIAKFVLYADLEKFAQLIVRECAAQAEEESSWPYSSFGKKIKEHFGVEE